MNRAVIAVLAVNLVLIGCDGSGSASAGASSTGSFVVGDMLVKSLIASGSSICAVSGKFLSTNESIKGSVTVVKGSLTQSLFEGTPAQRFKSTTTGTLTLGAIDLPLAVTSDAYYDVNYVFLGDQSDDEYRVVDGTYTYPAFVRVNDTATIGRLKRYSDGTKKNLLGIDEILYTVEPDTASTALFKEIGISRDNAGKTISVYTMLTRLNLDGTYKELGEVWIDYDEDDPLTLTYTCE